MPKKVFRQVDIDPPVTGGIELPDHFFLSSSDMDDDLPEDDLGRQVCLLLKLHPEISLQFRQSDLASMDDATKRYLIGDIEFALGIQPLSGTEL